MCAGFLLWERKAWYEESGEQKSEDVCGCSYIQMEDGEATIIATFRQPTPVSPKQTKQMKVAYAGFPINTACVLCSSCTQVPSVLSTFLRTVSNQVP